MALSTISGTTGITDATITSAKLADFAAAVDLNGVELLLDADQDTSITADTDDRIDFKLGGVEHISLNNSSGDTVIKPMVDGKDIVFQQYDGNKILEINDGNYVAISGAAAGPGELRFYEDTDLGTNYTGLKAGNATASVSYVLPLADGTDGYALTTDGSGTLSWSASGSNTPTSADGQALGSASLEWSDLFLADASTIQFGADQDVTLTHVHNTGLLLNSTMALQFNDASQYINAPSATVLDINATDEIELNATLVDINANVEISGTATTTGVHTFSAVPVLPANSIDSAHYVDGSIDNAHLADDAVDSDEIAAGAIDLAHMSVNSIDSDQYVDGSIDLAHMSVNSIDSDQYVDGSIDTAHIANDQITAALIADNAIDSDMYVDGSIDTAHIADDAVTADKLANAINTSIDAKLPLAGGTMTGHLLAGDNIHAKFGTGNDLDLYHDASSSRIKNSTGNLSLQSDTINLTNLADNNPHIFCNSTGVGINTSSPGYPLDVRKDQNGNTVGRVYNATAGNAAMSQVRVQSNSGLGILMNLDDGYSSTGIYQAATTTLFAASSSTGGLLLGTESDHPIRFYQGAAEKCRITSAGLTFGGDTAAANALDDYEVGTFTVTLTAESGTFTLNSDQNLLNYVKIGSLVYIGGRIKLSSISSPSGEVSVVGLPFAGNHGGGEQSAKSFIGVHFRDAAAAVGGVSGQVSASTFMIYEAGTTANTNVADKIDAGTYIMIGGTYRTDS